MIRLGVIGCGGMSRNFAERMQLIGDRVRVTAAVDLDATLAGKFADAFDHEVRVATDYHDVLDDVDAVLLVLPHDLHHPVTMTCLDAGKHVLVEKPMANTRAECLEMIDKARQADRVLMVAYVMRYHPLVRQFKDILDAKTYGDCFHLSIWTEQFTRFPPGHWTRSAKQLGGGQLFSHGCHYIDLLLWFLGDPVSGSHVGTNFGTPWMEKEGTSDVAITFASGAVGYHMGTWGARGARIGYAMHAHCTDGLIELDTASGRILLHQFEGDDGLIEPHIAEHANDTTTFGQITELAHTGTGKHTDKEVLHFIECIENNTTPETDGPESLKSLEVIWRLYEAEAQHRVADLTGLGLERR